MKPLIVYKASAGSGKTFTLATEYIKLLLQNPQSYRQTLAVTFTNKATEEMKTRILSQLYGIWHGLPESERYARKVQADLNISPEFASRQAGIALHQLLHNYSYFRVETIDSFFQSVLRNLARELDLTANLRIGLNDVQVEELAVDQLIDSLSSTDLMLQWLLSYIMENISDDLSWNVIGQIKLFGRTIFRDYYKQESHQLNARVGEKGFLDNYAASLRDIRSKALERMKSIGTAFFDELEGGGLTIDDLSYGRTGVASLFLKLQTGVFDGSIIGKRVTDCLGQPEKWYKKTHPQRELIHHLAETTLGDILHYAIDEQPRQWKLYKSADLTLRHLSQLRLLSSIEKKVRQLNEESNRFLLSDTQQLLHELIDNSDSPFIFEKIGTRLEHIMIDEFQDTSTVQWQNFKVLLEEAMSHEDTGNLIVGDVKQSIYRWRSGDWRLLAGIRQQFTHADERIDVRKLDTNYRSSRHVVSFNNIFFTRAAEAEQVAAYDDVAQKVPAGKGHDGYVQVTLLPANDYQQQTLRVLANQISTLTCQGINPTDIAILVRTNSNIPIIANYLMEQIPSLSVVSDEAFRLDSSPAVQTIIQAMRLLNDPDDAISRAYLQKVYSGRLDGPLPEGYTPTLLQLPLYELAEQLYSLFGLDRMSGQTAYLCAFYDQVASFVSDYAADVTAFLHEWDESVASKTIQSPEINGLRIISIHKSKGLEFPIVLIPFCDWRLEHNDILWCRPQEAPFNELPLAPIDYSQKGMSGTIYHNDYEEEHLQNVVDNLNLLYVAFTRASSQLYVYGRRGAKGSRSALIEQVLPEVAVELNDALLSGENDEQAPLTLAYGDVTSFHTTTRSRLLTSNPFLQQSMPVSVNIEVNTQKVVFRQSNKSREFAALTDETPNKSAATKPSYIQIGCVLHNLFSTIRTTDDVEKALKQLEQDGILYDDAITRERLEDMIRKRLASPRVAEWFAPDRWTLFNECTILGIDPATSQTCERRPDRVMTDGHETIVVDFKFGTERDEYHEQVREYMQLLTHMGMPCVKGYLWLVYSNKVIEVKR